MQAKVNAKVQNATDFKQAMLSRIEMTAIGPMLHLIFVNSRVPLLDHVHLEIEAGPVFAEAVAGRELEFVASDF